MISSQTARGMWYVDCRVVENVRAVRNNVRLQVLGYMSFRNELERDSVRNFPTTFSIEAGFMFRRDKLACPQDGTRLRCECIAISLQSPSPVIPWITLQVPSQQAASVLDWA